MTKVMVTVGVVGALVLGLAAVMRAEGNMAKAEGQSDLAVAVIEAAIASLRDHPNQLSVSINATGLQAANTGGIGFNASPTIAGGSGTVIGFQVKDFGNVQVLQGAANEVAQKQSAETVRVLEQIRDALQQGQKDKVQPLLSTLKEKAVDMIYEVVKAAALSQMGLLR